MRKISVMIMALLFLGVGFAGGFQTGRSSGFETGSEWALVQADLAAREAGVFMPVYFNEGKFRVVIKQKRGMYKRAWQLADQYEERGTAKAKEKQVQVAEAESQAKSEQIKF